MPLQTWWSRHVAETDLSTTRKGFRVKRITRKLLAKRKRPIERRLRKMQWADQRRPMLSGSNIHYEMADKTRAVGCGGIGAMHLLAQRIGLVEAINRDLHLLKVDLPYHESDPVLNIAYNILAGGRVWKTWNFVGRTRASSGRAGCPADAGPDDGGRLLPTVQGAAH